MQNIVSCSCIKLIAISNVQKFDDKIFIAAIKIIPSNYSPGTVSLLCNAIIQVIFFRSTFYNRLVKCLVSNITLIFALINFSPEIRQSSFWPRPWFFPFLIQMVNHCNVFVDGCPTDPGTVPVTVKLTLTLTSYLGETTSK